MDCSVIFLFYARRTMKWGCLLISQLESQAVYGNYLVFTQGKFHEFKCVNLLEKIFSRYGMWEVSSH